MKRFGSKVLIAALAMLMVCMSGCRFQDGQDYIWSFTSETENQYILIGEYGAWIDGEQYRFMPMAADLIEGWNRENAQVYVKSIKLMPDRAVFVHDYDSTRVYLDGGQDHYYKHKIGVFSFNYVTKTCEYVRDFQEVYAEAMYSPYPTIFHAIADERYGIFTYNGLLEVYDIDNKTTVFSQEIYDKMEAVRQVSYRQAETEEFLGNDYCRYNSETQTLYYYAYESASYTLHKFENFIHSSQLRLLRFGDVVVSFSVYDMEYKSAVSLDASKEISYDALDADIEGYLLQRDQDFIRPSDVFTIDGKTYQYTSHNKSGIIEIETGEVIFFNHTYFSERNEVFNQIEEYWRANLYASARIDQFTVVGTCDERILVSCQQSLSMFSIPPVIFEIDLKRDTVLYVGYPEIGSILSVFAM